MVWCLGLFLLCSRLMGFDIEGIPPPSFVSYWDIHSELEQDYIIIGAGIVGLSAAIELKLEEPDARVLVLERGTLPLGASSRNAGFACIGSFTEFLKDCEHIGRENATNLIVDRFLGLKTLRDKLGEEEIGFAMTGNYELVGEEFLPLLERLDEVNQWLKPYFGENVFERQDGKIKEFGFSKEHVSAVIFNKFEGLIDSGKLMQTLRKRAEGLGVSIRYGSQASRPVSSPTGLEVAVGKILFTAKAVGVCINAFTSELIPEIPIKPGRGQILVTEPLAEPLKLKAPAHMGQGYWFFRPLPGNRLLLGGGRHLDFEGETTTTLEITPEIMGPLKALLTSVILPGQNPKIERTWSGIMGFSDDHLPLVAEVPGLEKVVVGFGCNGMGIARGYRTGEKTAALLRSLQTR